MFDATVTETVESGAIHSGDYSKRELLIEEVRERYRKRVDFHRAEKIITLRIKAICRRFCAGDKDAAQKLYSALDKPESHPDAPLVREYVTSFIEARELLKAERKDAEKTLQRIARQLPIWTEWAKDIRGVAELSIAQIVGEAGDLSKYDTHSKLWKRMGVAVIDGERQRKCTDPTLAELHGYSPERRSIVWNLGECLVKQNGADGKYRKLYDARKTYEIERAEANGLTVKPGAYIAKRKPSERHKYMSKGHVHNRASRYMQKKFLRDMWQEWRKVM